MKLSLTDGIDDTYRPVVLVNGKVIPVWTLDLHAIATGHVEIILNGDDLPDGTELGISLHDWRGVFATFTVRHQT